VYFRNYEAYNASGLAFHEVARRVIQIVHHVSFLCFFGGLHLLLWWLLLRVWLEFQKRDSLRNTYCMPMHEINIMDA
jgi:hypothetical protein